MSVRKAMEAEQYRLLPVSLAGRPAHPVVSALIRILPVLLLLAVAPVAMKSQFGGRILLAGALLLAFFVTRSSPVSVLMAVTYLAVLGGMRRWISPVLGWAPNDPFLLVIPIYAGFCFLDKALLRRLPADTRISRLVLWFLAIMTIQIFNPLQGELTVGLAGALFYIVPLFWFYIGRDMGTPELLERLLRLVIIISVIAACYGLYQTFYGLAPVEEEWVKMVGAQYSAIRAGDALRVFSFFTSSIEYIHFVVIGIVALWAIWLHTRSVVALIPIPLLVVAVFLAGSRGPVVVMLFTCVLLTAVQGRNAKAWLPRLALTALLGIAGLVWSLKQVQTMDTGQATRALVAHQTGGLLNPLDEDKSTASIHGEMAGQGFVQALKTPLGMGLGATTMAASKYGGTSGGSTEVDLSDMFVSLGAPGGLIYTAILCMVLVAAFRHWHQARSLASLLILAVLISGLGSWMHGARYSTCMLIWFCIGALDQAARRRGRA